MTVVTVVAVQSLSCLCCSENGKIQYNIDRDCEDCGDFIAGNAAEMK